MRCQTLLVCTVFANTRANAKWVQFYKSQKVWGHDICKFEQKINCMSPHAMCESWQVCDHLLLVTHTYRHTDTCLNLQLLIFASPPSEMRLHPPGGQGDSPQSYPSPP